MHKMTVFIMLLSALALSGCNTADPASRATSNRYGDITVTVKVEGENNTATATFTMGDGALADSSGQGDLSNSPTQTNDVKPDIDVTVPVNKANAGTSSASGGALEQVLQAGAQKLGEAIKGDGKKDEATATAATAASNAPANPCNCTDGDCGGDCADCQCEMK